MIVVDTNIIGYLYLNSERTEQVERVLLKDPCWVAPNLWRSEFRSVLALYIRKELISLKEAKEMMKEAGLLMHDREYEAASHQVLNLVAASTLSAYDCEFVALAKDLKIKLVTVDKKILDQFPKYSISIEEYLSL